jgi:hypothetical protein
MLCIRRAPDDRPSLSKVRRLLHRITIAFIDQQKREIDRVIEREFASLFEDATVTGGFPQQQPSVHLTVSKVPVKCAPAGDG